MIDNESGQSLRRAMHAPEAADAGQAVKLVRRLSDEEEVFSLSDLQKAYLAGRGDSLPLGGTGCHLYGEFSGHRFDHARLEAAWRQTIARHPMLRAAVTQDSRLRCSPSVPEMRIPVTIATTTEAAEAAAAATREEMSHRVFDPFTWPMFDVRATVFPDGTTRIHAGFDLLPLDVASVQRVLRDWGLAYAGTVRHDRKADGVAGFSAATANGDLRRQAALEYWTTWATELPPPPSLPYKGPLTALRGARFNRRTTWLPPDRWEKLCLEAKRHGILPNAAVSGALAEVLRRWGAEGTWLLNLPIRKRRAPQATGFEVGNASSTLLAAVSPGADVADRMRRLQRNLTSSLRHRSVSGIEVLGLVRRAGRAIALQAPVVLTNLVGQTLDGAATTAGVNWLGKQTYGVSQTPQVVLDHQAHDLDGGVQFNWDGVDAAFPTGVLDDLVGAHEDLLRRLTDGGGWGDSVPDLRSRATRARRNLANDTGKLVPRGLLQHGLLAHAAAGPDRIAIFAASRDYSFGQVTAWAGRVASALRAAGTSRGDRVALVLRQSAAFVASAVGVLEAGAAYVPIDPTWPALRRRRVVELAGACVVITSEGLLEEDNWPAGTTVLDASVLPETGGATLPSPAEPTDLAYIIFTSGTMGDPKGVMVDHRGALNTCVDVTSRFSVTSQDRVIALSSPSFDLSVYDIFGLLGAGGAMVVPDASRTRDPEHWLDLMARHGVTLWNSVPAWMKMFVAYAEFSRSLSLDLRVIMLSGDWIPLDLPGRIRSLAPRAQTFSLGGATEASIWSICHPADPIEPGAASIPYGYPLANQTTHVLDAELTPLPDWVEGDIYIGGVGVALGYWGRPDLTAAAFVTCPRTGMRLYRTGDRGRYRRDGAIELLGREDYQVKIQGYRIELEEVEAALASCPEVGDAAALAVGQRFGEFCLTAFLVPSPEAAGSGLLLDGAARAAFKASSQGRIRGGADVVELPEGPPVSVRADRRSYTRFRDEQVQLRALAALLGTVRQGSDGRYLYPSAGGGYAVQTYVSVIPERVAGLDGGIYYVDPASRGLHRLSRLPIDFNVHLPLNRKVAERAAFTLVLAARMDAIEPLYGPLSRDFCLLEAGSMLQLLAGEASAQGLGLCPIGALNAGRVLEALNLADGYQVLHCMLGGVPVAEAIHLAPSSTGELTTELIPAAGPPAALADASAKRAFVEAIRRNLESRLPAALQPNDYHVLDALPLTPNGKVDRLALSALSEGAPVRSREVARASNLTEAALLKLIQDLVGKDDIGVDENFFDIGGTSLHLVQIPHLVERHLGKKITVMEGFQYPTIRLLANHLDGASVGPSSEASERAAARRSAMTRRGRGAATVS